MYRQHLEPLVELEDRLITLLSSPDEDEATHLDPTIPSWNGYSHGNDNGTTIAAPQNGKTAGWSNGRPAPTIYIPPTKQTKMSLARPPNGNATSSSQHSSPASSKTVSKDFSVHTSTNWKKAFALGGKSKSPKSAHSGEIEGWWEDPDDPVHILNACAPAMVELWRDPKVRARLREKRLRLEESSGL